MEEFAIGAEDEVSFAEGGVELRSELTGARIAAASGLLRLAAGVASEGVYALIVGAGKEGL